MGEEETQDYLTMGVGEGVPILPNDGGGGGESQDYLMIGVWGGGYQDQKRWRWG